ncbi:hypothetical protein NST07_25830 [Paenibacillus sp. FSL L8-0340]|uniref:hypothetical protein n=1 Tax=Paenibacillus sp. FSL L8-0340 TaxID=2954685 RepID=UPI0031592F48
MIYVVMAIAYYAVLTLGLIGVLALVAAGIYGLVRLYAFVLERVLVAKKLRDLFHTFMVTQLTAEARERE